MLPALVHQIFFCSLPHHCIHCILLIISICGMLGSFRRKEVLQPTVLWSKFWSPLHLCLNPVSISCKRVKLGKLVHLFAMLFSSVEWDYDNIQCTERALNVLVLACSTQLSQLLVLSDTSLFSFFVNVPWHQPCLSCPFFLQSGFSHKVGWHFWFFLKDCCLC